MAFTLNYTKSSNLAIDPIRIDDNNVSYSLFNPKNIIIKPHEVVKINTGLSFEMNGPYYAQLENIPEKTNFIVLAGVIDPGYRGDIIVALINMDNKEQTILAQERIAQLIFIPVLLPELIKEEEETEDLKDLQIYLKYSKTIESAFVPNRFDNCSVGYDLYATEDMHVVPFGLAKVDTGISFKLRGRPFYAQIRDKSGISTKRKLHVINGVVDSSNNNNSIIVYLLNLSSEEQHISANEAIAQIIFLNVLLPELVYQKDINRNTTRGDRGFTSGGICDHIYL